MVAYRTPRHDSGTEERAGVAGRPRASHRPYVYVGLRNVYTITAKPAGTQRAAATAATSGGGGGGSSGTIGAGGANAGMATPAMAIPPIRP
jgi:hypothetical protein